MPYYLPFSCCRPLLRMTSLEQYIQIEMSEQEWEYIPREAFLYFPLGDQVRTGSEEKQWRKIFEGGVEYTAWEEQALAKLEGRLQEKAVRVDEWFDRANKLRFLQANKFKTSNTLDSMQETTKWRAKEFPIQIDPAVTKMLNSGAFYFSGRDDKYRPIMVADIGKFDADDVDTIPRVLAVVMEFLIGELLIEGQVENYILVMNLEEANFSLRNVILKILSFTSNAYRGRLFASYILSMPTIIRWGWDGLISKFVSENTLKKIKITGEKVHEEMWTHVSKDVIERQYGGNLAKIEAPYWPPSKQLLRFINASKQAENNLVSPEKYLLLFQEGKLKGRKVLKSMVWNEPVKTETKGKSEVELPIETPRKEAAEGEKTPRSMVVSKGPLVSMVEVEEKNTIVIQQEASFLPDYHTIKTFFQSAQFRKICAISTS